MSPNTLYFTFIRANPPHKGHVRLIKYAKTHAENTNSDFKLYLSQTQNANNPLTFIEKYYIIKEISNHTPEYKLTINSPWDIIEHAKVEYDKLIFVVGSDRVDEFNRRWVPYARKEGFEAEILECTRTEDQITGTELRSCTDTDTFDRLAGYANCNLAKNTLEKIGKYKNMTTPRAKNAKPVQNTTCKQQ